MHVHLLNCGGMCPLGGRLFDGFRHSLTARPANPHRLWALSRERKDGVTLFGSHDAKALERLQVCAAQGGRA